MQIIPAIDLLNGKVVRLHKGAEETAKVYSEKPWEIADSFQSAGAEWIHIVDLDGAFGRSGINDSVIQRIIKQSSIPIQLGGGIRSVDAITAMFNLGISRIILGSIAVTYPDFARKAIQKFGQEHVIVGIDARDNKVSTHGWTKDNPIMAIDFAKEMAGFGVKRFIVTDINTDGMLCGVQPQLMLDIATQTGAKVIVSGGVASIADIDELMKKGDNIIEGVIIGRAIYENKLDLKEAIRGAKPGKTREALCS